MSTAWDEARIGGRAGQRFALGLWHPFYKLASIGWMPPVSERQKIHGKQRYCYALNFPIPDGALNVVLNDRFSVTQDFWLTDIAVGGKQIPADSYFQLFETRMQRRYMNVPIRWEGFAGAFASVEPIGLANATMPYFERRITKIPGGSQMMARGQFNFSPLAPPLGDTVQLVLGGYIG